MKPTKFKEQTKTLFGKGEVEPLPVYSDGIICVSCWKMRFTERIRALLFGRIFLIVKSGNTQPPVGMIVHRTGFN